MKKAYKIEVDCANCANLMEEAANKTDGVKVRLLILCFRRSRMLCLWS